MKSDERNRRIESRPFSILDEIKMHCLLWKSDYQFLRTNKFVQDAVAGVLDAIVIATSMHSAEIITSDTGDQKSAETKRFISIFKSKYMELTDLEYENIVNAATFVIIGGVVQKLIEQGSTAEEYLIWVFDDFFQEPGNKHMLPPNIKLVVSNFMVQKFLFIMKDTLAVRRKDTVNSRQRLALMKIAVELMELSRDEELGQMLLKFGNNKISYAKTEKFLRDFVEKAGFSGFKEKIDEISK